MYPSFPRPEMCINPVGILIKHGWSIYRRPKMSESHYSLYVPVTPPSGTRQTLSKDTHNRSQSSRSPTLHHSRCAPPPHPNSSFACSAPTRVRLVYLGDCIVIIPEAEKVPSGPWNHRSLRGAFTILGPDFIYQISLMSDIPGIHVFLYPSSS